MTRKEWYRQQAERHGSTIAHHVVINLSTTNPDDAYQWARIAAHFGMLALGFTTWRLDP